MYLNSSSYHRNSWHANFGDCSCRIRSSLQNTSSGFSIPIPQFVKSLKNTRVTCKKMLLSTPNSQLANAGKFLFPPEFSNAFIPLCSAAIRSHLPAPQTEVSTFHGFWRVVRLLSLPQAGWGGGGGVFVLFV